MADTSTNSGGGSASRATDAYMSLDAPHVVLDAAGVPKTYACNQPLGTQAAFAAFYPNGLPVTYNMVHGRDSGGVPNQYIENHLPVRFYTHPPATAQGKFSTMYGQQAFRKTGDLLPERRVHLWNRDEIQSVCNSLRVIFWADMKRLTRPYRWDDLWEFFDAHDLYHYGALNLWNVINTLYDENKLIGNEWNGEAMMEIGRFADQWLKKEENRNKLAEWNSLKGGIVCVLASEDWQEIGDIQDDEMGLLKCALHYRRDLLLSGGLKQYIVPPQDLVSAVNSGAVVNWLADTQVLGENGLPSPPVAEAHQSTMNPIVPCFVQDGNHYYHPLGQNAPVAEPPKVSAVEALRESSELEVPRKTKKMPPTGVVTESGVVIAMGSSKLPPRWDERVAETVARFVATEAAQSADETTTSQATTQECQAATDALPVCHTLGDDNSIAPVLKTPRASASSPDLKDASLWSTDKKKEAVGAHDEVQNPEEMAVHHGQVTHDQASADENAVTRPVVITETASTSTATEHGKTDSPTVVQPQSSVVPVAEMQPD
ncbi:hypothetical protein JDV02_009813 [Purpureocillium takamizusanense]|uniref:Uncharacterized protein n=1 Tax=Purpureocillium takamizusanense TaxID=2060973 RepID=A0A9Q8VFW6_9HYPO|nr:uncharacterized protein JDV02_009813 [Purpureocillium takamizusanense]UNI24033.1 hypothetical protein JDV02_009813 [Purpureocillium takamizusanense]